MSTEPDADSGTDEADRGQKPYETILGQEIEDGLIELRRSTGGLFLSGLSAGLDIGFGPLLMAIVITIPAGGLAPPLYELLIASAYSVGFIFVVVGRSNLFTEHTTMAALPVLDGRASRRQLGRLWGVIYASNVVGGTVFAAIAVVVGPATGTVEPAAFVELATPLVEYSWWVTFLAAVLAGWLMGLLTWLVVAARDTISTVVFIWMVASVIGVGHLPHCIAGTVEVLFGVMASPAVSVQAFVGFLVWSTAGNAVGGVVFVALLKYTHAVRGGEHPTDVTVNVGRPPESQDRTSDWRR